MAQRRLGSDANIVTFPRPEGTVRAGCTSSDGNLVSEAAVAALAPYLCTVVVVLVTAITTVLASVRLAFPLTNYPWLFPDSYDWIVNGLAYGKGGAFPISHRPLLLPLLLGVLYRIGHEDWIVLFGLSGYCITVLAVLYWLPRLAEESTAYAAALLITVSSCILGQSAYVGSDVVANALLTIMALSWAAAIRADDAKLLLPAACAAGLGIHSQYVEVALIPFMILLSFVRVEEGRLRARMSRWRFFVRPYALLSATTGLCVALLPVLLRYRRYGIVYTEQVQHGSLVHLHWSVPYYLQNLPVAFSLPTVLVALVGIVAAVVSPRSRFIALLMVGWILSVGFFFACLYTWRDNRFLIYVSVPVLYFAAEGAVSIIRGVGRLLGGGLPPTAIAVVLAAVLGYYGIACTSTQPFDMVFSLSPTSAMELESPPPAFASEDTPEAIATRRWVVKHLDASLYPVAFYREALQKLSDQLSADIDTQYLSEPLLRLLSRMGEPLAQQNLLDRVTYYEALSSAEWYYVKNRNIEYLKYFLNSETTPAEVMNKLTARTPSILVVRENDFASFPAELHQLCATPPIDREAPFVALKCGEK